MDAPLFRSRALDARRRAGSDEPLDLRTAAWTGLAVAAVALVIAVCAFVMVVEIPRRVTVRGYLTPEHGVIQVRAPNAATIVEQFVAQGDEVEMGQAILRLDSRQEAVVRAPRSGRILRLPHRAGGSLHAGQVVATLGPAGSPLRAVLLIPPAAAGMVTVGQAIVLRFDAFPYQRFGTRQGQVMRVGGSVVMPGESEHPFALTDPVFEALASLDADHLEAYGRRWPLSNDQAFEADVVLERATVLERMLDPLRSMAGSGR
jgi:multidrug efflux pump subunit AcrA (membrane-fusion protein)